MLRIFYFSLYGRKTVNNGKNAICQVWFSKVTLDILIEFLSPDVSLFMLSEIKNEIESKLNREIDLIHAPVDENSLIKIDKVVDIYAQ